ncbi:hypothetical protein WJX84_005377 [Apatococcus fuscideae]|uniref:Glycosyltransferase family 92 protein n=1 Tax=Apatococcus fuscideae TaxID=2026836 RepID=A0AAW1SRE6_9CHLO
MCTYVPQSGWFLSSASNTYHLAAEAGPAALLFKTFGPKTLPAKVFEGHASRRNVQKLIGQELAIYSPTSHMDILSVHDGSALKHSPAHQQEHPRELLDNPQHASPNDTSAQALSTEAPRLVACTLMKNEVPYLVEWIEFHRLMGFTHLAIYDDGSHDNSHLIERLYRQHGREYVSYDRQPEYVGDLIDPNDFEAHSRMRRVQAAGACLHKYKHLADWIIHLDIDEFVWSPRHKDLRTFFQTGIPQDNHILYAGATRFGAEHMRHRHTYTLEEVEVPDGSWEVQLTNPNGLQLLTNSHFHRAPDKRFGEPEELLKDSNEFCRMWKNQMGRMSPCMNDADGQYGKTFLRASHATGLWTHGGSVFGDFGWIQADDGTSLSSEIFPEPTKCPAPTCARSNPTNIHIYHYRSPSIEDDVKKSVDWRWSEHPEEGLHQSDDDYAASTWFYNQMRDVSLFQFAEALQQRMMPLLTPQATTRRSF